MLATRRTRLTNEEHLSVAGGFLLDDHPMKPSLSSPVEDQMLAAVLLTNSRLSTLLKSATAISTIVADACNSTKLQLDLIDDRLRDSTSRILESHLEKF